VIHIFVLALLACTAIVILRMRGLLAAAMLTGIYSFLSAGWMLVLDAPDVAFTEAAVGAGISTVLMLSALSLTTTRAVRRRRKTLIPLAAVTLTGAALVYGTFDMPRYGDPDSPAQRHLGNGYLERSPEEIGVPNVVTGVLASYRGYDTLGETTVVFTACVGVMLLLRGRPRRPKEPQA